jgi:multidrug efflux pump subunit AcrB
MKKFNLIEAAMKYKQIGFTIVLILMIYGVVALIKMPRQEFPEFNVPVGVVVAVLPGATSAQVENQLTRPIENYLFSYPEINKSKTYSQSKDGVVFIFIEVNEGIKNTRVFWNKLKHGLNDLKGSLSPDLMGPWVNDDFGNTSATLISFESNTKSYKELDYQAKELENQLRKIESVSRISRLGMQNDEIKISLQNEKLTYNNIKPLVIINMLKSEGKVNYAGDINANQIDVPIHFSSKYKTLEDISQQIVYSDASGNVIRLKDISTIERVQKEPTSFITNNGTKTVLISLEMLTGYNIVEFGDEVNKIIDKQKKNIPNDIKVSLIVDQPGTVEHAVLSFLKEFGISILAVILITVLLLPLRVSAIAGATIPITILITLGIIYIFGIQLHTVSLASLIIVLGIVVDDSVVIIDNYIEKLDSGRTRWQAAKESATELFMPVFTATFTILFAFFPLYIFMTGPGKDFIEALPLTIATALLTSLLVAYFIVPYICYFFIKKGLAKEEHKKHKKTILDYMQSAYDYTIHIIFKVPKLALIVALALTVVSVLIGLNLNQELFPKLDKNQFAVEIHVADGSTLDETEKVVKDLEKRLLEDKRVVSVTSFIGSGSPRFHSIYAPHMPAKNYAQMIVNTSSTDVTTILLDEYATKFLNYYPNAMVRFKQLDFQFSKAPVEIRISGDSIPQIKKVATEVAEILRKNKGVSWVASNWESERQTISYDINRTEANRLGFSQTDISAYLAVGQKGFPVTTLWEDEYPIDVVLTREKQSKNADFNFNDMYISSIFTPTVIPFRQIATAKPEWTEGTIVRRNGVRTLTLEVDVRRDALAASVMKEEGDKIKSLSLPEGITIDFGGEIEQQGLYYMVFAKAIGLGIICIFLIILMQFKTAKATILIMITIPLSIFGAVLGLIITGYPFGFTSFIGLMSLCGVVVRNGIILVDYANKIREEQNLSVLDAAISAGKRRMRPIFLTSAAAAVGVIPMIIYKSLLWAPLATVLCFGLMFSMLLTLYVLPVIYYYFYRADDKRLHLSEENLEVENA